MIKLTRMNDEEFYVNSDLIQFIESTPETILTLVNAKKVTVKETPKQIIDAVVEYQRRLFPFIKEEQLKKMAE